MLVMNCSDDRLMQSFGKRAPIPQGLTERSIPPTMHVFEPGEVKELDDETAAFLVQPEKLGARGVVAFEYHEDRAVVCRRGRTLWFRWLKARIHLWGKENEDRKLRGWGPMEPTETIQLQIAQYESLRKHEFSDPLAALAKVPDLSPSTNIVPDAELMRHFHEEQARVEAEPEAASA